METRYRLNTLSYAEYSKEKSKIILSLLELLDKLDDL